MKRIIFLLLSGMLMWMVSCSGSKGENNIVTIETKFGNIVVKLYDLTPEHRDNFLKLADEGFYNGLLFHRVISNFMIQGGDPDSRNAKAGNRLGGGSPGYTIPAEFVPEFYHKKGALAAARKGGKSNPEKRSSGSQFYIVQGKIFTSGALDTLEMNLNYKAKRELLNEHFSASSEELNELKKNNDQQGFQIRIAEIREKADSIYNTRQPIQFTDEQREVYTTIGGYPSLDGEYTVFGEVVEGLDILDKIAAVETDQYDRPLSDIIMEIKRGR